ncbi:hypothetical protein L1077_04260 [Pseudoalteromonas luteoviolacea]|uniref:hypothetical protein n=1 Tax=Pseudoalteromonas luteoviolacea TaxID=43657 RepID=UPI001F3CAD8D|nr:hypothetical protein [Pseudoalteromonas luteoviolacea]MCF6438641.1 hypothetical protein [Pseudoalteromonas luteoviolacea]
MFWIAVIGFALSVIIPAIEDASIPKLNDEQTQRVCKAAIATIFNKPIDIVKVSHVTGDVIYLKYTRSEDQTVWKSKCYLKGKRVVWGSVGNGTSGRWRLHQYDPVVTWTLKSGRIVIKDKISESSETTKVFSL